MATAQKKAATVTKITAAKSAPAAKAPAAKAAPAAKTTAPAAKAPAAKAAPKAKAPPKAKVPTELEVGVVVLFNGYPADTPEEDKLIPEGHRAAIIEVAEGEQPDDPLSYIIRVPNPEFNPEIAEDPTTNPSEIETGAWAEELTIDADQTLEDSAPVETAPSTVVKNGKTKNVAKQEVPVDPATQPADDELPELAQEDADVLALVQDNAEVEGGLIGLVQDMEAEVEQKNYQIGGILYHIKRDKLYLDIKPEYAEAKGFALFVEDHFGFGYRKAMNLIDIYVQFNLLGVENAADVVASMGWAKAARIAAVMDESNAADMIELASTRTLKDLGDAIKTQNVSVGGTPGEKKVKTTLKLRYFEDEAADITATLAEVQEQQGLKTVEEAFQFIVTEFRMAQGNEAPVEAAPQQTAAAPAARAKVQAKPATRRGQAVNA